MTPLSCDAANLYIEAAAVGEAIPEDVRAHIDACRLCAARLSLATRIDGALRQRAVASPPATFSAGVMARLRRERWRAEQVVDLGFNVAVAAGVLFILSGLGGLAWWFGALQIDDNMTRLVQDALAVVARRAAADTRVLMFGMLLVTTAAGLWWWSEEDVAL